MYDEQYGIAVALAYIRWTPLPPQDWAKLKIILTRRFQPHDLTAAYKAQFRTRKRQKSEDIPTYVDALHKLAEMAWPLLDPFPRDEMVADQFLNGLDSHELWVQVAVTGIRRIEDLMHVAQSLEAIENQETGHGQQGRGSTQTRFSEAEGPETEAMRIVDQILAKLGSELRQSRDLKRRLPLEGRNASEVWTGRHLPLLQRIPLRANEPRKPWSIIGDAHHLQIGADLETERGHLNAISARVTALHEGLPEWGFLHGGA